MNIANKGSTGFGEVESCLGDLGISCSQCRYHDACLEYDVENKSLDRS